jgi:hypothetical protein
MKYTKPQVVSVASAASAVRGEKTDITRNDGQPLNPVRGTTAAYQCDE